MDIYKTPKSDVAPSTPKKPLQIEKYVLGVYFYPKFIHYLTLLDNHIANFAYRSLHQKVEFLGMIPIYLVCFAYFFNLKIPFVRVCQVWLVLIVLNHLKYELVTFTTFSSLIKTVPLLWPVYAIAGAYLFYIHPTLHNKGVKSTSTV